MATPSFWRKSCPVGLRKRASEVHASSMLLRRLEVSFRGGRVGWLYTQSNMISTVSLTGTFVKRLSTSNEAIIPEGSLE